MTPMAALTLVSALVHSFLLIWTTKLIRLCHRLNWI